MGLQIIRTAIDNGVNFLDNACCYHGGKSEEIMGRALKDGYRNKVVLMTKNHGRDYASFKKHLELSLARLQVDCIDLVQFHEVIEDDMPERLFKDGAVDAAVEARKEGKIRFIGFTGHKKPSIFLDMLQRDFKWDTVQLPISVLDYHFRSFTQEIIPILVERKIGVIGMKSLAGGNLMRTGTLKAEECLRYSMSLPVSTVVVGMESLPLLKKYMQVAAAFQEMTETEKTELLQRSKPFGMNGEYEPFKTTRRYDSGY